VEGQRKKVMVGLAGLVLVLGSAAVARAGTITVCQVGCTFQAIQPAINAAAASGDVVLVSDGVYVETIDYGSKSVAVRSVNGPYSTRIDGNGSGPVVSFFGAGAGATLEGFTVTGGSVNGNGAGIRMANSSPTITGCIITGNTATGGGRGGGMHLSASSSPKVTGCVITFNRALSGAGVSIESSGGVFTDCVLSHHSVTQYGGAVYLSGAAPVFASCVVSANRGSFGGGVGAENTTPTLVANHVRGHNANPGGGV